MVTFSQQRQWGSLTLRTDFTRPETPVWYTLNDGIEREAPFQAANFFTKGAPDRPRALNAVAAWLNDNTDLDEREN